MSQTHACAERALETHIGQALRLQRRLRGLGQAEVAAAVSISVADLERYESGSAGLPAADLWRLSVVLETPVSEFVAGFDRPSTQAREA